MGLVQHQTWRTFPLCPHASPFPLTVFDGGRDELESLGLYPLCCDLHPPPPTRLCFGQSRRGVIGEEDAGWTVTFRNATGGWRSVQGKRKAVAGKDARLPWLGFPCRRMWEASGKVCGTVGPKAPDLFLSSALFGAPPLTGVRWWRTRVKVRSAAGSFC